METNTPTQFMQNVFEWLPFGVDEATKDCARKWEAFDGEYHYQEGALLDALLFRIILLSQLV